MRCVCGYEQEKDFECFRYEERATWEQDGSAIVGTRSHVIPSMFICPRCGTLKTKLKKPVKICCDCDKTDGICYTSNPPQVRCTITGAFHYYGDHCDVEGESKEEAE